MRIPRSSAASQLVRAGATTLLLSPPTIRDYGIILRALEGRFGVTDDGAPLVTMNDPQALDYFCEPEGFALVLWVAARRDRPGWTIDDAGALIEELSGDSTCGHSPHGDAPHEGGDVLAALASAVMHEVFVRPGSDDAARDLSHWKAKPAGAGKPLHLVNFGKILERADVREFDPVAVAGWTLDQLANKLAGGMPDVEQGVTLTADEADDWFRRMADPAYREELRKQRAAEDAAEMRQPHRMN